MGKVEARIRVVVHGVVILGKVDISQHAIKEYFPKVHHAVFMPFHVRFMGYASFTFMDLNDISVIADVHGLVFNVQAPFVPEKLPIH